jgi:hypothetical protein
MQRRAGLRPARGGAQPQPPPVVPARRRGRGRGGRGRAQQPPAIVPAVLQQPGAVILPPVIQQPVIQPPGPLPPNLPAIVPLLPGNPQGDFEHVLEFIIGLDTQAKRDRFLVNAGCTTVEDLIYVETDSLVLTVPGSRHPYNLQNTI